MDRPPPVHMRFTINLRNSSESYPSTVYTVVPYDKAHSVTPTMCPPGGMPHSLQFIWLNISGTFQNTPKPYNCCFLMIRCFQWHWPSVPRGYAPPTPVHIRLNILDTVQNPTTKPHTLLFMIRCIQWHRPTPPVHIMLNISETVQNPTLNYIYCFPYDKTHSVIPTIRPLGVCRTPFGSYKA